jgi:uncharacterized protein YbjT (DUF2867 family)
VQEGHSVKVVSSKAERKKDIEALGATAAIGSIEDVHFLTSAFAGADAVYCMLPPGNFAASNFDLIAHANEVAKNYANAISQSGVKRAVHLSSIGAHTDKGNGILIFHFNAENILRKLPSDVAITFMRPVGFYYNMFGFINTIKAQGVIASSYGASDFVPLVSPIDIAAEVAEEIAAPSAGQKIRYVASDELTCNEVASILGAAVGQPGLKWIVIPGEQLHSGLQAAGMNPSVATGFVEMNASIHSGELFEDYYRHKPMLGKTKVKDFAKEFAAVFNGR